MADKIEKELTSALKIKREKDEADQDYFKRFVTQGSKVLDKDETVWDKLSESAQKWWNAADEAIEKGQTIPNFDGEVVEPEPEDTGDGEDGGKGEEAGESEEAAQETTTTRRRSSGKDKPTGKADKKKATEKADDKPKTDNNKKKAGAKDEGAGKPGRKGSFSDTDVVKTVKKDNPFREGSKAAKCYEQYKVGKSVADILKAKVPRAKLARHIKKGVLTVGPKK